MAKGVSKQQAATLIGKDVMARKKDGAIVTGKLVAIRGNTLMLEDREGKPVKTKGLIPLLLFDVAAIGGGFGYPWYGYGYPGFGYGYPGFGYFI